MTSFISLPVITDTMSLQENKTQIIKNKNNNN